jgi:5-methylcytosine-specific restriction endonuclease McrA
MNVSVLDWNPTKATIKKLINRDFDKKTAWKAFRSSSSSYTKKKYVRAFVFLFNDNKCENCLSSKNLQIDHIKSVYNCFYDYDYKFCNTVKNLQILCAKCNNIKSHYDV